ncbi:MAG TPA: hypothetical protein VNV60_05340 [Holophagaceae bacterium]|jgi:hypothetical protein|nr:hypothetical protein [Holophagaceae bacterium]
MSWVEQATDFVKAGFTLEVAKERLLLWAERLDFAETKEASLKEERDTLKANLGKLAPRTAKLEAENAELKAAKETRDAFTEHRGALFRRKPDGGWHPVAYCPKCLVSCARDGAGHLPLVCSIKACGWRTSFSEQNLETVLAELGK